jgi:hypothetical protein
LRALIWREISATLFYGEGPPGADQRSDESSTAPELALASFLFESAAAASDPGAETAWDFEIRDRIREIDDDGRVRGVAYADVMRDAERRLAP